MEPNLEAKLKLRYHNESLHEIVTKAYEKHKIIRYNNELISQYQPIFFDPEPRHYFDFRSHFYAPHKYFAGRMWDTFYFNTFALWVFTILLYLTLYYNFLHRILNTLSSIKLPSGFKLKLKIPKLAKLRKSAK
jgi:hypothetical protein